MAVLLGATALATGAVVLVLNLLTTDGASGACVVTLDDGSTATMAADQADNAALLGAVAMHRELPARGVTVAIATALQESKLRNIDYGDRDSVGLFQQRPSQGWGTVEQIMDPVYSTNAFYDVLVTVEGWEAKEVTDAAQDVQRSAFPDAYAQHEGRGRAFASALTGYSPAALVCHLDAPEDGESSTATGSAGGAQRLAVVEDRLTRDFVSVATAVAPGGVLVVDATSVPAGLDADPARRAWAVAQWAVAAASETGARVVAVDGRAWVRDDGEDAAWVPLVEADVPAAVTEAAAGAGPGAVVIS
uniref:hypothetical protein n=1 Tax=Georgenia subflava TaxID=1622177 RepID=UPI00186B1D05|nr:hypothetical protein [Georgenia subflava]